MMFTYRTGPSTLCLPYVCLTYACRMFGTVCICIVSCQQLMSQSDNVT